VFCLSCRELSRVDETNVFHKWRALIWLLSEPSPALPPIPTQPSSTIPSPPLYHTGEANTELLRDTSGGEFDDLVSAPRMVLEQYIRTQVLDLSFNQFLVYTITSLRAPQWWHGHGAGLCIMLGTRR